MKMILLLLFSLLLSVAAVEAAGIGAAPAELSFNIEKGSKQQKELTVYNLENAEIEFEVISNAAFLQFYHNRIIAPFGSEKIIVEATAQDLKKGVYNEFIQITALNSANGVGIRVGTAVMAKVSVYTTNTTSVFLGILTSAAIIAVGLLAYLAAANLKKMPAMLRKA